MRRGALLALVSAAILLLGGAGRVDAYCCVFTDPQAMLLSPDGRFGYVVNPNGTTIVRRAAGSGELSLVDDSDVGGREAAMSSDGASLYVTDRGQIRPARRDKDTGLLTAGPPAAVPSGAAVEAMTVSPDGRDLYATEQRGGPVLVFSRDVASGALTYAGSAPGSGRGLPAHWGSIVVTGDGRFVYAGTSSGVSGYARDADTGALSPVGETATNLARATLLLGADQSRLYAGGNAYAVLARDPSSGTISVTGTYDLTAESVSGPTALAPDGRDLYTIASGAISHVAVTAGGLEARQTYRNYVDGVRGLRGAQIVTVAPDGRQVYVASGPDPYYTRTGPGSDVRPAVVIFDRDGATGDLVYRGIFDPALGKPRPSATEPRFTIDHGAEFTRDRQVTLTFSGPFFDIEVSNDGGFRSATSLGAGGGPSRSYPWTLASSGPERLPKTVYARTTGPFPEQAKDDIVLDERPPEVVSASLLGLAASARAVSASRARSVRVVARDRVSGVAAVQLAQGRGRPGRWRPYRARGGYPVTGAAQVRVRVRDRAGNLSRWRRVVTVRRGRRRR